MPWLFKTHPCQKPMMFEIEKEQAGNGSEWQCPDPNCNQVWELLEENFWTKSSTSPLVIKESVNGENESGNQGPSGEGEISSVPGD